MKYIIIFSIIGMIFPNSLFSQNLEVEGKAKIAEMDDDITTDSLVVLRPGGELARRHISSIPDNTGGWTEVLDTTSTMKRVGIGTTSPEVRLQVNHLLQGSIFPSLRVYQHNCGSLCGQFDGMALQLINENESNADNGGRLSFAEMANVIAQDEGAATINLIARDVTYGRGGLAFSTRSSLGFGEKMRIDTLGNVGIGTTTPDTKLHVNGDLKVAGIISGVSDPVNDQDAATKAYVDLLEAEILFLKEFLGITPITDIDGNEYATIKIGFQRWMAENLKTTKYNDGTMIEKVTDNTEWSNLTTPAYSWYSNDSTSNAGLYGALYNGYSIAETNSLNVCPTGWHVPSESDWTVLRNFLIDNGYGFEGSGSDIGKSIANTFGWTSSGTPGHVGNDQNTNNSSGFAGLPGGKRDPNGVFEDIEDQCNWWTSTNIGINTGVKFYMMHDASFFSLTEPNKKNGFSVRCIKD